MSPRRLTAPVDARCSALGLALAFSSCLLLGCLPPREPHDGSQAVAAADELTVSAVTLQGQGLERGCLPTGLEQCFNAVDDDCNGLVDEGCGVPDAPLVLLAAWGDNPADVDWVVTLPDGTVIDKRRRNSAPFRYDRDCPSAGCHGQNVEIFSADGASLPRGSYRAELRLTDPKSARFPVEVSVSLRFGRRMEHARVRLDLEHDAQVVTFVL